MVLYTRGNLIQMSRHSAWLVPWLFDFPSLYAPVSIEFLDYIKNLILIKNPISNICLKLLLGRITKENQLFYRHLTLPYIPCTHLIFIGLRYYFVKNTLDYSPFDDNRVNETEPTLHV